MNANDFQQYKEAFRQRQIQSPSRVVQQIIIRKLGDDPKCEIKTLHLLYVDANWRAGAIARPVAWLDQVVDVWKNLTIDTGTQADTAPRWALDVKSVTVEVSGTTLKVGGKMVEVQ